MSSHEIEQKYSSGGGAPTAARIVAAARRNGGSKGDMSRAGALVRDIAIKLLLPVFAHRQDWMYQYNPRVL